MAELIDIEAELERLGRERKRLEGEVARAQGKLNNEGFVSKAPQKVIDEERAKLADYTDKLAKVSERIGTLRK